LFDSGGFADVGLQDPCQLLDLRHAGKPNLTRALDVFRLTDQYLPCVLKQRALEEQEGAVALEAVDENDVFSVERIARMPPLEHLVEVAIQCNVAQGCIFLAPRRVLAEE